MYGMSHRVQNVLTECKCGATSHLELVVLHGVAQEEGVRGGGALRQQHLRPVLTKLVALCNQCSSALVAFFVLLL